MPIRVRTDVPYGNACDVTVIDSAPVAEVHFAADPHGGPECLWFCFRIVREGDSTLTPAKTKVVLKYPETMLGGAGIDRIRPVVRTPDADWQRLPGGQRENLPDGRVDAIWFIDTPREWVDFAFCYPYGTADLQETVAVCRGYWRADTIGVSQGGRPLQRLSNDPGTPNGGRPGIYLLARQHSGETTGSWVLDGFLRRLPQLADKAPLVWAAPLTNIDGVEQGDYGKDNFPYDLNRAWGSPPMRHEVLVFQHDLQRWQRRCRPVLAVDFHSPGGTEADGAYFYLPDPDKEPEQHRAAAAWAERFAQAIGPDYMSANFGRVARYASRWETPTVRAYCSDRLKICCLCLETPYAMAGKTLLTREGYREMGKRLADSIVAEINK